MGSDRRDEDRHQHQSAGEVAVGRVARRVQLAHRMGGVRLEEDRQRQEVHGQPAHPTEQEAVAQQLGALVIFRGEFGGEGRGWDFEGADEAADQDRRRHQIGEQRALAPPLWRSPQQQVGERDRHGGGVHEGVPPTPFRPRVVRQLADDRIDEGVDDQRDHDRQPDLGRGQADDLGVEEGQEVGKAVVLHPEGHRAEAVEEPRRAAQASAAGMDHCVC